MEPISILGAFGCGFVTGMIFMAGITVSIVHCFNLPNKRNEK